MIGLKVIGLRTVQVLTNHLLPVPSKQLTSYYCSLYTRKHIPIQLLITKKMYVEFVTKGFSCPTFSSYLVCLYNDLTAFQNEVSL